MGNGEELCLLCDLALTRCGLRVAVEKKARNFATQVFFIPNQLLLACQEEASGHAGVF